MKQTIIDFIKVSVSLALGIYIFWLVYRDIDFHQIKELLDGRISYAGLFFSAVIAIFSHIARAKRWQMLIKPLGKDPALNELTNTVFINYGVNILLPRVGEFTRCGIVAKRNEMKFTQLVGTLVSERMVDILTVLSILLVAVGLQFPMFVDFFERYPTILPKLIGILTSPWFYLLIIGAALGLYGIYKNFSHLYLVSRTKKAIRNVVEGFKTIAKIPSLGSFLFYSVLIWLFYCLQLYVMMQSFNVTREVSFLVCYVTFAMTCIAGIVPVQGGIGAWHFAVITSLVYYGIGGVEARAFALVAHGFTTLLSGVLGIYGFLALGKSDKIEKTLFSKHNK